MNELDLGEEKFDMFFHLAWEGTTGASRNDMYLQNRNVKHTVDAVGLASRLGCSVFVGTGSQAEYGRVEGALNSRTPAFPENGYGIAKLCAGQMSRVACRAKGIRHIWVRILSVYGPFDGAQSLISTAISKISNGEPTAFTSGEQMWDYMYSGDAAKAMTELAMSGKDGGIYCLGSGKVRPLHEYIEVIRDIIAPDTELGLGKMPYPDGQVMHLQADVSELERDTGYVPSTRFEDGIAKTIQWYNQRKD
jgi:nucleoside-diphosphate-sugar epimerase